MISHITNPHNNNIYSIGYLFGVNYTSLDLEFPAYW